MEIWEYDLKQAKDNLESANILFDKGFISLSAFHAQQSIELGIKAVAFKYNFEQYLKKRPKFKFSHIPARGLTSEIYDFVIESLELSDTSQFDDKMNENLSEAISKVKKIINIFNEIEEHKNGDKFEEIWKSSLGIDSSEEITSIEAYKKFFETKLSNELCLGVSNLCRKAVLDMQQFARKTHQEFKFKLAKKIVKEIFPDYGLDENIIDAFFTNKETFDEKIKGIVGTMDFLLSPKGFLNAFNDPRLPSKILQKWDIKKRISFIWISYLVTISPTVVLLFPHVIVGRYPRLIKSVNKNSEDLYHENSFKVRQLIDETDRTLKRFKHIFFIRYDLFIY